MKPSIYTVTFILLTNFCNGQFKFKIDKGSTKFSAEIMVTTCKKGDCNGKGTIDLYDRITKKKFQTFYSDNLDFSVDKSNNPTVNVIELYGEQSPLIFDDFNFDGTEDFAIRNGNESSYGGPSYDVYVYYSTKKQFVPSADLSELAYNHLGMFETDHKRKRLSTFDKSGCCWHLKTEYSVIPKRGLVKVAEFEEDATKGEMVVVTKRKLINDKWTVKIEKHNRKDYYKE
jgi:hypothetical protein